ERDSGVEPVAVEFLDLFARREPPQMQEAFAVVARVDGLADGLPRALELDRIVDLARGSPIRAESQVDPHIGVGADVPHPCRPRGRALDRELRWTQRNDVHPVSVTDRADALAHPLTALGPRGRDHREADR